MKCVSIACCVALTAAATPVAAATYCADRTDLVEQLERKYGETQRSVGLAQGRGLFEVFASENGSWTILLTTPQGKSCLMAAGQGFEELPPKTLVEDVPT